MIAQDASVSVYV